MNDKHCAITRQQTARGNNVSHANNKTRRCFRVNFRNVRMDLGPLGTRTLCISQRGSRQIMKKGGIVELLLTTHQRYLGDTGRRLKRDLEKALKKSE
jgi:large subunit ribosomal protein L28